MPVHEQSAQEHEACFVDYVIKLPFFVDLAPVRRRRQTTILPSVEFRSVDVLTLLFNNSFLVNHVSYQIQS